MMCMFCSWFFKTKRCPQTVNGLEASGISCEFTPLVPAQEVLGPGILEETVESIEYVHKSDIH
jgi:hypothetical protein